MTSQGVLLGALLVAVGGCGQVMDLGSNCDNPDPGHHNLLGVPDPCFDDGSLASSCAGECVPKAPVLWFGPDLLWMGPASEMPTCPDQAPQEGFRGHADPTGAPID